MKTVIALYDRIHEARRAVDALKTEAFTPEDISLVAHDANNRYSRHLDDDTTYEVEESGSMAGEGAAAGAGIGAVVGGLAGFLAGVGTVALPGLGPLIVAGPIASTLAGAGIGAAAGGLLGALIGWGIPEEEAHVYAEGVRRGGTLVVVRAEDDRAAEAATILAKFDPVDVEERSRSWRDRGWGGYEREADPYTLDEIERERRYYTEEHEPTEQRTGEVCVGSYACPPNTGGATGTPDSYEEPVRHNAPSTRGHTKGRPTTDSGRITSSSGDAGQGDVFAQNQARAGSADYQSHTAATGSTFTGAQSGRVDMDRYEPEFRQHFESTDDRPNFRQYKPAYFVGADLASRQEYADREWREVEPEARRHWESSEHESTWEEVKDYARYAWNRIRH